MIVSSDQELMTKPAALTVNLDLLKNSKIIPDSQRAHSNIYV